MVEEALRNDVPSNRLNTHVEALQAPQAGRNRRYA